MSKKWKKSYLNNKIYKYKPNILRYNPKTTRYYIKINLKK